MAAFVIVDYYEMLDRNLYEKYSLRGAPTVETHGGCGLAGTDTVEVLEGNWHPYRLVLLRFETINQAKEWFASSEYQTAVKIRKQAAKCNIILVEGN
jgi:uncharacterized protein (DUF1330 family)